MTGESLKLVAVVCMLVDHVAWSFVPTESALGILMHCVGRITMPVMAFMIAEGYVHTHDFKRYAGRLLVFAMISDIPFMMFERTTGTHNVMFDLLFGLMAIWFQDSNMKEWQKNIIIAFIGGLAAFFDWSFVGVLLCVSIWYFRDSFVGISFAIICVAILAILVYGQWWQISMVLSLPLLRLYNGERGRGSKWAFYAFYPGHLVLLAALRAVI